MDLSIIHKTQGEEMGMQNKMGNDYESCGVFKVKETFDKTDVKGNNNLINSLKTEMNINCGHNPGSLFQGVVSFGEENNSEEETSLFEYSSFRKAIDLRIHNRMDDGARRTIFEDADYFAKNYSYKLLPITFDNVDEAIIHTEHNYCHLTLSSGSEAEEDCSRTMDYIQIKEKNYKKRKTKFRQAENKSDDGGEHYDIISSFQAPDKEDGDRSRVGSNDSKIIHFPESESRNLAGNSFLAQPLDLSSPLVQEQKTEHCLREHQTSIVNNSSNNNIEKKEDSDKENLKSKRRSIEVTITRPDEKENYQPCDLFLSDIARLVPRLIEKDCFKIDILDRTCDSYDSIRKHRLYYIISESAWRLFQSTSERVILTNDPTLGQPARKTEKDEKPTFLIFDKFSLAKCLADYCREIGGCFEYTCVEESKEEVTSVETRTEEEDKKSEVEGEENDFEVNGEKSMTKELEVQLEEVENIQIEEESVNEERVGEMDEKKEVKDVCCESLTNVEMKSEKVDEEEKSEKINEEEKSEKVDEEEKSEKESPKNLCNLKMTPGEAEIKKYLHNGKNVFTETIEECDANKAEANGSEVKKELENLNEPKKKSNEHDECLNEIFLTEEIRSSNKEETNEAEDFVGRSKVKIENKKESYRGARKQKVPEVTKTKKRDSPLKKPKANSLETKNEKPVARSKRNSITRRSQKDSKMEEVKARSHVRTRSKSKSEIPSKTVTSQNSDKPKDGQKRKESASEKASSNPEASKKKRYGSGEICISEESFERRTRSGKSLEVKNKTDAVGKKSIKRKEESREGVKQNEMGGLKIQKKRKLEKREEAPKIANEIKSERLRARKETQMVNVEDSKKVVLNQGKRKAKGKTS